MPAYLLHATDTAGEDASFEEWAPTLAEARARAEEALLGTDTRLDPLPTDCPVRLALRKVQWMNRGVQGSSALWEAQDELCRDPDPDVKWLQERERCLRSLVEDAASLAKAAQELAIEAAAGLPEIERWRASVAVETRAAE